MWGVGGGKIARVTEIESLSGVCGVWRWIGLREVEGVVLDGYVMVS